MATEIPLITVVLDDPPSTSDPANFDARGDVFLGAFPDLKDEQNAMAEAMNTVAVEMEERGEEIEELAAEVAAAALVASDAAGYVARSTSTLSVSAGTKIVHFTAAKPDLAALSERVWIVSATDPSVRMIGNIAVTDNSDDIQVTVVSSGVFGSGSGSNWLIIDAAFFSAACTAVELWAQATDAAAITPKTLKDAKVWVALTDAATVTPSGLNGRNFTWTITADRTLGAITNCSVNDVYWVWITQNATGGWDIAWAGAYKRVGGLPTIAQTAGQKTLLMVKVTAVDGSGTMTDSVVTVAANPTN